MKAITFPTIAWKSNAALQVFKVLRWIMPLGIFVFAWLFWKQQLFERPLNMILFFVWVALTGFFLLSPFFLYAIKMFRTFKVQGVIVFDANGITIGNTCYPYKTITSVAFHYGGLHGEALQQKGKLVRMSRGISQLHFTANGEPISCHFLVKDEAAKEQLQYVLTHLYIRNVRLTETNTMGATYLLFNLTPAQEAQFRKSNSLEPTT